MSPSSAQYTKFSSRLSRSFTLIELLIVIAIIAVLATVVILTLNPAQLLAAARDANRVSDIHTLNQALNLYAEDVGGNMGNSSVIYVSVPDPAATSTLGDQCQGLGLSASALPSGWSWHCAASSTYEDVNGTGWVPVDFRKISSGSPMGKLPVDPTNTTSSGLYFTYTANGDPWELAANMESQKYQAGGSNDVVSTDGGQYPDLYEVGTDLSLLPIDYDPSLVGYWKLDEGSGTVAYDASGHGDDLSWSGTEAGTSGYYSAGKVGAWSGYFNGTDDEATYTLPTSWQGDFTVSLWVKANVLGQAGHDGLFANNTSTGGTTFQIDFDGTNPGNYDFYVTGSDDWSFGPATTSWVFLTAALTGTTVHLYYNGALAATHTLSTGDTANHFGDYILGVNRIGSYYSSVTLDDVRIYNRALSGSEIQAIYNAEK